MDFAIHIAFPSTLRMQIKVLACLSRMLARPLWRRSAWLSPAEIMAGQSAKVQPVSTYRIGASRSKAAQLQVYLNRSLHIRMQRTCPLSSVGWFIAAQPSPNWLAVMFSVTGDGGMGAYSSLTLQLWE